MAPSNEAWLKPAILSALSSTPSNSPTLLPSQIFLLQCSPINGSPITPVHALLSDKHTHINAVISVHAGQLFCKRLEQSGLGMLSQALVALKHYTLMLQQSNGNKEALPKLLIMVEELNFLSPCRNFPKTTTLLDEDEEIASRIRYVYHDFFKEPRPKPPDHCDYRIDPDAIQLIVQNSHKSALVPGWSQISRPAHDDDKDDDTIDSEPAKDRSISSSPKPAEMSSLQFLSPEKIMRSSTDLDCKQPEIVSEPLQDDVVMNEISNATPEGIVKDDNLRNVDDALLGNIAKDREIPQSESVDVEPAHADNPDSRIQQNGADTNYSMHPEIEVIDCIDEDVFPGEFTPGLTQFGLDDIEELDFHTALVELPILIDLTIASDQETDRTSFKVSVKKEVISPKRSRPSIHIEYPDESEPAEEIIRQQPVNITVDSRVPSDSNIPDLDANANKLEIASVHNLQSETETAQGIAKNPEKSAKEAMQKSEIQLKMRKSASLQSGSISIQNTGTRLKKSGATSCRQENGSRSKMSATATTIQRTDNHAKNLGSQHADIHLKAAMDKDAASLPTPEPDLNKNKQLQETWRKLKSSGVLKCQSHSKSPGLQSDRSNNGDKRLQPHNQTFMEPINTVTAKSDEESGSRKRQQNNGSVKAAKQNAEIVQKVSNLSEAQAYASEISETRFDMVSSRPQKKQKMASTSVDVHEGDNNRLDSRESNEPESSNTKMLTSHDLLLATLKYTTARFRRRKR